MNVPRLPQAAAPSRNRVRVHPRSTAAILVLALAAITSGCVVIPISAAPTAIDPARVIDLSYSYGPETVYWPTAESFHLERVHYGPTPGGFFYAANNICMAEHGGTHMDAPIHFAEGKRTAAEVPIEQCIGAAAVIDVRAQAAADPDYRLRVADLEAWEDDYGTIPAGAIVVMNSGWGRRWPDKKSYLGTDQPGDVANLHFPGFSREAATFLVDQRDIAAIAVDTPSIDHGPSQDFIVHQIINGADKPGFENLANVERLPPSGATILALPIKIEGGSGGPARIIAILP